MLKKYCLKLNKENVDGTEASFLNNNIQVKNGKFFARLYDKRDAFSFQIVNYPNLSGNIPKRTSYGVYISQILRYYTSCMEYSDFIDRCIVLSEKLLDQNYEKTTLRYTLKKTLTCYPEITGKYSVSFDKMCCDLNY